MENKDTKTDYQEVVSAGDQKREIVAIPIGIILFIHLFINFFIEIHIHYFLYIHEIFKSHLKNISANSH